MKFTLFTQQQQQSSDTSEGTSIQPSNKPSQLQIKDSLAAHLPLAHSTMRWKRQTEHSQWLRIFMYGKRI